MGIRAVENFDSSFELEEEVGKTCCTGMVPSVLMGKQEEKDWSKDDSCWLCSHKKP